MVQQQLNRHGEIPRKSVIQSYVTAEEKKHAIDLAAAVNEAVPETVTLSDLVRLLLKTANKKRVLALRSQQHKKESV